MCKRIRTPWGYADYNKVYAEGVTFYGTPGHGGFKLDRKRNAQVNEALRIKGGWYEEDCEWAVVAYTFPDLFSAENREKALRTLKNWNPDGYEAVTGETIPVGESYEKDRRQFKIDHTNDWVVVSAVTSKRFPGFVSCTATKGGKREFDGAKRDYLVPSAEYETRNHFGFVIDEKSHARVLV